MQVLPLTVEAHEFSVRDLIGGDPAVDFVNTVTGRDRAPRDRLDSYRRLLDWAALVELVPEKYLVALARKARRHPAAAARALARAKSFREELFVLLTHVIAGNEPPKPALARLREQWVKGIEAHELCFDARRLVLKLRDDAADFDLIAAVTGYRIVERVLRVPADRLRICQGGNCSWLFIDNSKAGLRRWCDMAACGNSAKSQRFRARARRRSR